MFATLTNLLTNGSTTLQNFTFQNATGTNATTTNLYVSGLASTTSLRANTGLFGNVGIGLSNPTTKLHISDITANAPQILVENTSTYGIRLGLNSSNVGFMGSANATPVQIQTNSIARMYFDTAGNVGIGTSSPAGGQLVISSSTGPQLALTDASLTNNVWTFRNLGNNLYISTSSPTSFSTSTNPVVSIDGILGNVKIGTTSESYASSYTSTSTKLQVGGAGKFGFGSYGTSNQTTVTDASLIIPTGGQIYMENAQGFLRTLIKSDGSGNVDIGQSGTAIVPSISLKAGNAGYISMIPGGGEAMRIVSSGLVGIGTTTPIANVDIFKASGDASQGFTSSSTAGVQMAWTIGTDISDSGKFKISSSTLLGLNDRFVIDGSGNVGIGTASPGAKLQVYGDGASSAGTILIDQPTSPTGSTSVGPHIFFKSAGVNRGWIGFFDASAHGNGTEMNLRGYAGLRLSGASTGDHLYVNTSGNVGIGTTTPTTLLNVYGDASFGQAAKSTIFIRGSAGTAISFNRNPTSGAITNTGAYSYQLNHTESTTNTSDYLAWQIYDTAGNSVANNAFVLNGVGNVGIGTTSPLTKLSVAGNAYIGGWLMATGTASIAGNTYLGSELLVMGSTTLQNFTGTSGTTTNFFATNLTATNLTFTNEITTNSTSTNATTTNLYVSGLASTTNLRANTALLGNVGIGTTTSLTEALTVDGNIKLNNNTLSAQSITLDSETSIGLRVTNPNGYVSITPLNTSGAHIYTSLPRFYFNVAPTSITGAFSAYSTTDLSLQTGSGASTRMTIKAATGNVGIGTTTPEGRLDILSTNTPGIGAEPTVKGTLRILDAGGDTASAGGLEFKSAATGNGYGWRLTAPDEVGAPGSLYFQKRANSASWTNAVTFRGDSGNVGIGTTSPYARLSVWGSDTSATTRAFEVANNASTTMFSVFNNGLAAATNFLVNGSSTLQAFTGTNYLALGSTTLQSFTGTNGIITNATTTNATTTYLYVSGLASTTDIHSNTADIGSLVARNFLANGSTTLQTFTATQATINATSTISNLTNSQEYSIALTLGTEEWVKLATIPNHSYATFVGNIGSTNSEETFKIDIGTTHTTSLALIDVDRQTYNARLSEVKVEGADGGTRTIYVRIRTSDFAPTMTWRVLNAKGAITVVNATSTTPTGATFATLPVTVNTSNNTTKTPIFFKGNADAYATFTASSTAGVSLAWSLGTDLSDSGKFKISSSTALGSSDRFVIDGNGNVGIGTTTPLSKLAVSGGVSIGSNYNIAAPTDGLIVEGSVGIGRSSAGASKLQILATGSGFTQEKTIGGYFYSMGFNANNPYLTYYSSTGMTIGYGEATGAAPTVNTMTLLNNGNVGIGSTTPLTKLSVAGNTYLGGNVTATGTATVYGSLMVLSSTTLQVVGATYASTTQIQSTGQAYLATSGGNVGIGTAAPAYKLEVVGTLGHDNIQISKETAINSGTYGVTYKTLMLGEEGSRSISLNYDPSTNTSTNFNGIDQIFIQDSKGILAPNTADNAFIGVLRPMNDRVYFGGSLSSGDLLGDGMTILSSSGNVGVGSTSPLTKLSVAGSAYIGGWLVATGTAQIDGATVLNSTLFVNSSTTLQNFTAQNATTTNATTTKFAITGLSSQIPYASPNGAIVPLTIGTNLTLTNGTLSSAPTFTFPFTTQTDWGTHNATSTIIGFKAGFYSLASSTIGNSTTGGGLTIFGGATTTNNFLVLGSTTLQNLTTTNATTTNLYVSGLASTTDIHSNLANIGALTVGPITSGLINGQTISSTASFTGTVNAVTGYKLNGAATSGNYLRGDGTNFVSSAIQVSDVPTLNQSTTGSAGTLLREDNRTIIPTELTSAYLKFGFTSFANNDSSPYADFLHMRSYTDASGGNDNLVMFNKSSIGMRIYQQTWAASTSAYSSYKDAVLTDVGSANVTLLGSTTLQAITRTTELALGSTTLQSFTGTNGIITNATTTNATTTNLYVSGLASSSALRANTALFGGNVGIGTTTPTALLSVQGATANQLMLSYDATNSTRIFTNSGGALVLDPSDAGETIYFGAAGTYYMKGGSSGSNLYALTLNRSGGNPAVADIWSGGNALVIGGTSAGAGTVTINTSGGAAPTAYFTSSSVGIGTTTPTRQLTVAGVGTGILRIDGSFSGAPARRSMLELSSDDAGRAQGVITISAGTEGWFYGKPYSADAFTIGYGSSQAEYPAQSKFYITSAGNVGIGSSSPLTKLSVAGSAYIGGWLVATGTAQIDGATVLKSTLLVNSSTTLQSFTGTNGIITNATTTNATTTNFYVSGLASTTNLRANVANIGNLTVTTCSGCSGGTIAWPFTKLSTGEQATSTTLAFLNGFISTASSTINSNLAITGSLGVGTSTPSGFKVDVAGNVILSGDTRSLQIGQSGGQTLYFQNSSNGISFNNNQFQFLTTQTSGFNFSGGNVGIGTTTPSRALTISSSAAPQLALTDASLTSNAWTMRSLGNFFYLATSSPTSYATSTVPSLTITPNNMVGIGTSTPAAATLSVQGSIYSSGNVMTSGQLLGSLPFNFLTTPTASPSINMSTYSTLLNWATGSGVSDLFRLQTDASANGTGSLLLVQTGAGATVKPLNVYAGSAQALTIDTSGNTGLGTTSPGARLDVNQISGQPGAFFGDIAGTGTGGTMRFISAQGPNSTADYYIQLNNNARSATGGVFRFTGRFGANETLSVDVANQRVGIGSSTPGTTLAVVGTTTGYGFVPSANLAYGLGSTGQRFKDVWVGTANIGTSTWSISNGSDGRLTFNNAANSAGTETVSLATNGNVGIGVTNPQFTLEISGSTKISGNLSSTSISMSSMSPYWATYSAGGGAAGKTLKLNASTTVIFTGGAININKIGSYGTVQVSSYAINAGIDVNFWSASPPYGDMILLDSSRLVFTYAYSSWGTKAVVCTISGDAVQSCGSPVTVKSGTSQPWHSKLINVGDGTNFIVAYTDTTSGSGVFARVGVTSGTTISSFGTEASFSDGGWNTTYPTISMFVATTTRFVLGWYNATLTSGRYVVGNTSGTTITFGQRENGVMTHSSPSAGDALMPLSDSNMLVFAPITGGTVLHQISVTGTSTIATSTLAALSNSATTPYVDLLDYQTVVVGYGTNFRILNISSSTVTNIGSPQSTPSVSHQYIVGISTTSFISNLRILKTRDMSLTHGIDSFDTSQALAITTSNPTTMRTIKLSDSKFVHVIDVGSQIQMKAGTYTSTGIERVGALQTISTTTNYLSAAALSDSAFIITNSSNTGGASSGGHVDAWICSVDTANTITCGTARRIFDSYVAGAIYNSVDSFGSSNFIIGYATSTNAAATVVAGAWSGTSITSLGTPQTSGSGLSITGVALARIYGTTTQFAFAYVDNTAISPAKNKVVIGTISGTTITLGSTANLTSATSSNIRIVSNSPDTFIAYSTLTSGNALIHGAISNEYSVATTSVPFETLATPTMSVLDTSHIMLSSGADFIIFETAPSGITRMQNRQTVRTGAVTYFSSMENIAAFSTTSAIVSYYTDNLGGSTNTYSVAILFDTAALNYQSKALVIKETGTSLFGDPRVGINNTSPLYALHVNAPTGETTVAGFSNGSYTCTVNPADTALTCTSDIRLKNNISTLASSTDIIRKLRGVNFSWKNDETNANHIGFIAQEVQTIAPELVSEGPNGILGVNYLNFAPYLVNAWNALDVRVSSLEGIATSTLPATSTPMLSVTSTGLGIGTLTPAFALHAKFGGEGTAVFENENGICEINPNTGSFGCAPNRGAVVATSTIGTSLASSTEIIKKLRGVNLSLMSASSSVSQFGFLAEDVEMIAPELVSNVGGIKLVKTTEMIPLLVNSVADLAVKIDTIDERLAKLEALVATTTTATSTTATSTGITLGGLDLQFVVDAVVGAFQNMTTQISFNIAKFSTVFADNIIIGSKEKPSGITLYDIATREPFCMRIQNGGQITTQGACSDVLFVNTTPTDGGTTSGDTSGAVVITDVATTTTTASSDTATSTTTASTDSATTTASTDTTTTTASTETGTTAVTTDTSTPTASTDTTTTTASTDTSTTTASETPAEPTASADTTQPTASSEPTPPTG